MSPLPESSQGDEGDLTPVDGVPSTLPPVPTDDAGDLGQVADRAARPGGAAADAEPVAMTTEEVLVAPSEERRMPRWVVPAVVVFWSGFLGAIAVRFFWGKLSGLFILVAISVFLSLAIEPGVNRLARRGWRRGSATALLLFGVLAMFLVFVAAIGTLVGTQVADLLSNSEEYKIGRASCRERVL